MKRFAPALLLLALVAGCRGHAPGLHPHGAPPGQVKKAVYRCGSCGITKSVAGSCHGKVMILVP